MFIIYGDDEQVPRELVIKALTTQGYSAIGLDTSKSEEMTVRLQSLITENGSPEIFILDGHNILLDSAGNQLYDMTPLGLVGWLREHGLDSNCKFILYSNDDRLVEQARANKRLQFQAAVPKGGASGGLTALLKAVAEVAQADKAK